MIDMTKITAIFTDASLELRDLRSMTDAEISKLRIEARKRGLIGRWRQKTIAAKIRSMEQMGALAWFRIANADARKHNIH